MDRGVGENEKEGKGANPAPAKEDEANLSLAAAIKVQKLFRGFKDRHKWKRRVLIEAWDELEKREESELHYSSREIGRMTEMYESLAKNAVIDSDGAKKERRPSAVLKNKDEDKKDAFKPTLSWLTAFMDNCRNPSENKTIMEEKKLESLLTQASAALKKLPNVVDIELKGKVSLIIVGDLHGQIRDLLHILKTQGLPTKDKWFLFNGDFVDRGKNACEVTIILFVLKLLFGDWVFLNRGNHEADDINARDGFMDECTSKYSTAMYKAYNQCFAALPLVHIINKKTMVVHGGLCWDAGVTVKKIQEIDRFCLHPAWESIMEDLLWSDPGGPKHCGASQNDRGCGCIFGEDIVDEFFEDNPPLKMVIRSHEKKDQGFEEHFHGKLVTVFSASNYCGDNGNDGAVLEVFPDLKYKIHQFYATPMKEDDAKFSDRYCTLSATVAAKLIHRIAENRLELLEYYSKCTGLNKEAKEVKNDKQSVITRVEWARGLREILGLRIRFLFLQETLGLPLRGVNGKKKGKINYMGWLSKFAPSNTKLLKLSVKEGGVKIQETLEKITNLLLKHRVAVKSMFRYFDANCDGKVSPEELTNGLVCLSKVYNEDFSEEEVKKLVAELDKDGDASIDYSEFCEAFSVANPQLAEAIKKVPADTVMRGSGSKLEKVNSKRGVRVSRLNSVNPESQ